MDYPVAPDARATYPSLAGKRVLVTGGGSGIGAGIVEGFARQRADALFFDIAEEDSRALAGRLGCRFEEADLTDIPATWALARELGEEGGAFDVLVNNAANDDRHGFSPVRACWTGPALGGAGQARLRPWR